MDYFKRKIRKYVHCNMLRHLVSLKSEALIVCSRWHTTLNWTARMTAILKITPDYFGCLLRFFFNYFLKAQTLTKSSRALKEGLATTKIICQFPLYLLPHLCPSSTSAGGLGNSQDLRPSCPALMIAAST